MTKKNYKTIGILGGMGPKATIQLFDYIVSHTPAHVDQDHIPVFINNLPQIPDRTQALLYGGEDPVPYMAKGIASLELAGADFVIVACNTSHAFFGKLQKRVSIPLVNMIEETASYIKKTYPHIHKVGLLATTGTIRTRIYQQCFSQNNIKIITPDNNVQESKVMNAIYGKLGIKAGFTNYYPRHLLKTAAKKLLEQGAEAVVMGCTEIPLVLSQNYVSAPLINPSEILAKRAIELAVQESKSIFPQSNTSHNLFSRINTIEQN